MSLWFEFSFRFTSKYKAFWKENLVVNQMSLGTFFPCTPSILCTSDMVKFVLQAKGDRIPTTQSGSGTGRKPAEKKPADKKQADKKPVEKKQADKKPGEH